MEQRRKIIIPTGTDPEETLATPHFDAEATLSAQPVVPLNEPAALPPQEAYAVRGGGAAYAPRVVATSPWKRSTLMLIILAAVGVGIASGLAIGLYQTRKAAPVPVAAQPSANESQRAATQPEPELAQPPVVEPPQQQPEAEARVPDTTTEKETKSRPTNNSDEGDDDKRVARDSSKRDETRSAPPVVRERPTVTVPIIEERDDDDRQARREERRQERKERRREDRRRQREENEDSPLNVPRGVERARQDINRIRDIFEGRQP
jgi:hypothetical protein